MADMVKGLKVDSHSKEQNNAICCNMDGPIPKTIPKKKKCKKAKCCLRRPYK